MTLFKWIGSSCFPRRDGSGNVYIIYLAEKQPDGQYRPVTTRTSNGTSAGTFVDVEVYNAALAQKFNGWDNVEAVWGPRSALLAVKKG